MPLRGSPEKREEKERTRAALLRAALQLGSMHGFASVGLREVARVAGIAPTSFYRHFADMEELGLALVEDLVAPVLFELGARAERAAPNTDDVISTVIDAMLAHSDADPELARFTVAELVGSSPSRRSALRAQLAVLMEKLRRLLAEPGGPAPSEAVCDAFVALLLDGYARALDCKPDQRAALRDGLIAPLQRMLRPGTNRSDA